jgi:succinate-semialdehyde dehydrogenase/glutarate-semialdehyde dehydrogenase
MTTTAGASSDLDRGPDLDRLLGYVTTAGDDHDRVPVTAPFTGEEIGSIPQCGADDVEAALDRADEAQRAWADTPVDERAAVLSRFHDLVLDRREEILDVLQLEGGQARRDAYEEVLDAASAARHYAHRADGYLESERRKGPFPLVSKTRVHHHPVGIVGIISPWNYPFTLTVSDAVPALLAGNSVVLKPAEQTPYAAMLGKELLVEAGLPAGCFEIVTGRGEPVGEPLVAGSDYVCFTGSTEVGRHVAALAGEHLVDCSMELGGHNPMLVLEDADLEAAVDGAVKGCFSNAGQLCISFERVLVQESIYEEFVERFAERTAALRLGTDYDYEVEVGSLISEDHFEKVRSHVDGAVERGATVEAGGEARPDVGPYVFEPTVLTDVPDDAVTACEETFGPVAVVDSYADLDDAVERANDTDYGLHASVWTGDSTRGHRVATRIEAGTVGVNDAYVAAWSSMDAPMGGMKDSGIGRRHGPEGFYKYTESQTVSSLRGGPMMMPDDGDSFAALADRMTRLLRWTKNVPGLR